MKLVGTNQKIEVINKSKGIVTRGRFSLDAGESRVIETVRFHDDVLKALEKFYLLKAIDLKVADVEKSELKSNSDVVKKESIKNEHGDKHEHTVYDPESAKRERLINVESHDSGKAIEVGFDKTDAVDFLEKHWKTIEKELDLVKDMDRLSLLLATAKEIGMEGNKKYELIEDRIASLK
jgi:hypothetical protein